LNVLHVTALEVAQNLFGDVREVEGVEDHPLILAALRMAATWPEHDEVPWCSAVPYMVAVALGLPKPERQGLMARSWLGVGSGVSLDDAEAANDLTVLSRGDDPPGPEVLDAPGHVGFFAGVQAGKVLVWGGNQNDAANLAYFPQSRILGIRRLV
jgi:uncharacterized protein (TIGR02594 family)